MILIAAFLFASYMAYQLWDAMNHSYKPLPREKSEKREKAVSIDDPFTILLIGTDVRKATDENWRPDVLMVAAVNPHTQSIKMVSIPRDTYTEIANTNGLKTKINSAAYYGKQAGVGGEANTVETVENFLNIPIDYYAKINFSGFMEVVDAVGGVDVNVKFPFSVRLFGEMLYFQEGPAHLNGKQALGYVRMRKSDPRGDLGRNERQREVLQDLMEKIVSIRSIHKLDDIIRSVGNNVSYNLEFSELTALQKLYRSIPRENVESIEIHGTNSKNNPRGIWYYMVSDQERLRVSHILQKQLELPLETLDGQPYQGEPTDQQPQQGDSTSPGGDPSQVQPGTNQ